MKLSACIEWLFADEAEAVSDRIRKAKLAGLDAVEFWFWTNKDIDGIEAALKETGLELSSLVAEPMIPLTDPDNQKAFLEGLRKTVAIAQRLGAKVLIAQTGPDLPGKSRQEQRAALVSCLKAAADVLAGTGVRLGVEPLNTLTVHKGYFLPSTKEALDIVEEVGRQEIGIVYDVYHSYVMGETIEDVLSDRVQHVLHAHVADHPGRNEPGTGDLDLGAHLSWLFANGYTGPVGLEYRPSLGTSASMPAVIARLKQSGSQPL